MPSLVLTSSLRRDSAWLSSSDGQPPAECRQWVSRVGRPVPAPIVRSSLVSGRIQSVPESSQHPVWGLASSATIVAALAIPWRLPLRKREAASAPPAGNEAASAHSACSTAVESIAVRVLRTGRELQLPATLRILELRRVSFSPQSWFPFCPPRLRPFLSGSERRRTVRPDRRGSGYITF